MPIALVLLLGGLAGAQDPGGAKKSQEPASNPKPETESKQKPKAEPEKGQDDTSKAAEILRKKLGLDKGPGDKESIPKGPESRPASRPAAKETAGKSGEQKAPESEPATRPAAAPEDPQGDEGQKKQARPPRRDETESAADLLRRALGLDKGPGDSKSIPKGPGPAGEKHPEARTSELEEPGTPGAVEAPERRDGPSVEEMTVFGLEVGGSLSLRYRARTAKLDDDQDLSGLLSVDIGNADRDAVSGRLSLRGYHDLDGQQTENIFNGLEHARSGATDFRLYEAYVNVHEVDLGTARIGRQDQYETPVFVTFDGLRLESEPRGDQQLVFGAYGGIPVHYFESSARGDEVFGLSAEGRFWEGGRARLDWMHLRDRLQTGSQSNELVGVSWWQSVDQYVRFRGRHTWVDWRAQNLQLRADGQIPDTDFDFSAEYRDLLSRQSAYATELDPYFSVLQEYEPYHQLHVVGNWHPSEDFVLTAGFDVRRLHDVREERIFNREWGRFYVSPQWRNAFEPGLDVSLIFENWDSDSEDTFTVGGDVRLRIDPEFRIDFGTTYQRYASDLLNGRERERVRAYYLRLEHEPRSNLRWTAAYEFERNDFDDFHTFRVGLLWRF